jgi:PAS domain S-box-containing protein
MPVGAHGSVAGGIAVWGLSADMTLVQRLLILVGALLAILVGVGVYGITLYHDAREASVRRDLGQTLAFVSAEYGRFVEHARDSLLIASLEAPRAVADAAMCQALLDSLRVPDFNWLRLDILDARGVVRCSTAAEDVGTDQSDYPEVIAARTDRPAARGEYAWGLFSGSPGVPGLTVATAWHGPNGASGVITGAARLDPFVRTLRALVPEGYATMLADRGGRLLAMEPAAADVIGHSLPPSLAPLALMTQPGQTVARWSDGSDRLVAYAPAEVPGQQGVFIAVGYPLAAVSADVWALAYPAGLAPLGAAVGAFLLAWWGGVHFIRRPLAKLGEVALRWRDGDQSARVTLPGRSEIARLGRVFNAMADAKDHSDRQIREGWELFSALIESSRDCIFVTDRDGRLVLANSTFLDMLGLTRDTAIGHKLIVHRDRDVQRAMGALQEKVFATRMPQAADVSVQALDDRRRRVLQTICAPIFGSAGEIRSIAGIGRDVTEAREAAETLREARDRAEAADHAKTRFLAAASHDLRQPLQAAILLADLIAQRPENAAPASASADGLRRTLDDMKRLVDSLFDVSRLDSGAVQPEVTAFPMQLLLDQITVAYRRLAGIKGIALVVIPTDAVVRSDRVLLARMLSNLIQNAVRYTHSGQVKIECRTAGDRLRIRIEDTGVGISQQDLSRIWQEFEQLHNPERDRRQGLGLGLSIVRRLATLLDHPVEVTSGPGQGSCFIVSVPLQEERHTALLKAPTNNAAISDVVGRLVVIIDDDPLVLETLRMTLEEYGLNVIAAPDCADAVRRLGSPGRVPDLVLADYRLRDGQVGAEAIAAIRDAVGSQVPAIILTGELASHGDDIDQPLEDAQRLGAALFRKPIRSTELLEAIRSMMAAPTA